MKSVSRTTLLLGPPLVNGKEESSLHPPSPGCEDSVSSDSEFSDIYTIIKSAHDENDTSTNPNNVKVYLMTLKGWIFSGLDSNDSDDDFQSCAPQQSVTNEGGGHHCPLAPNEVIDDHCINVNSDDIQVSGHWCPRPSIVGPTFSVKQSCEEYGSPYGNPTDLPS